MNGMSMDGATTPVGADVGSRGDLLRRADEAIAAADARILSARRTVPVVLWSLGLVVMVMIQFSADLRSNDVGSALLPALGVVWWLVARSVPGKAFVGHLVAFVAVIVVGAATAPWAEDVDGTAAHTFFLTVWGAVAAGAAWSSWTYATQGRRLVREADGWWSARREPRLRGLDATDLDLDVATAHDVRDRADADTALHAVAARDYQAQFGVGLPSVKPVAALTVTGVLGLALSLAPVVGLDDSPWAAADAVCGLVLLAPWVVAGANMTGVIRRRQAESDRSIVEAQLYSARQYVATGRASTRFRRTTVLATPVGPLLAVGWIAVLVGRLRSSSDLAIVLTGVVLLVATVVVVAIAVHRSRRTLVFPLEGDGPSVLQAPAREVVLDLTEDGLTLSDRTGRATPHTVPAGDILAVEPVKGVSALSRRGVGIVTKDAPIVLVGRSIHEDPAIVRLQALLLAERA